MDPHIYDIGRKLIQSLGPETTVVRLYVYGSRVRGDHDPGSDLDLLVELEELTAQAKKDIQDQAWKLSLEEGYVISVAIVSREAFENGPLAASEYARRVRREGVEIAA
jgi:predicted nucleotidyltransferase